MPGDGRAAGSRAGRPWPARASAVADHVGGRPPAGAEHDGHVVAVDAGGGGRSRPRRPGRREAGVGGGHGRSLGRPGRCHRAAITTPVPRIRSGGGRATASEAGAGRRLRHGQGDRPVHRRRCAGARQDPPPRRRGPSSRPAGRGRDALDARPAATWEPDVGPGLPHVGRRPGHRRLAPVGGRRARPTASPQGAAAILRPEPVGSQHGEAEPVGVLTAGCGRRGGSRSASSAGDWTPERAHRGQPPAIPASARRGTGRSPGPGRAGHRRPGAGRRLRSGSSDRGCRPCRTAPAAGPDPPTAHPARARSGPGAGASGAGDERHQRRPAGDAVTCRGAGAAALRPAA